MIRPDSSDKMEAWYRRQFAQLNSETRSVVRLRYLCNILHAVPWLFFAAWGFYVAKYPNNELGTLWRWVTAAVFGLLHGACVLGPFGFYAALKRWSESLATKRAALQQQFQHDRTFNSGSDPDHFPA